MGSVADDLLRGAGEIAEEVFGNRSEKNKRRIYHMHERRHLPTFSYAGGIAARRSTIRQHVADAERAALATTDQELTD
jgi:hypothetical protein